MIVTLIVDASFCPETKVGAWAAVAKSNRSKDLLISHMNYVRHSGDAEVMAIRYALQTAFQRKYIRRGDAVRIFTDCVPAISLFTGERKPCSLDTHYEQLALDFVRHFCKANKLTLVFDHVKGHSSGTSPLEFNHNWCDANARRAMQSYRDKLLQKRNENNG